MFMYFQLKSELFHLNKPNLVVKRTGFNLHINKSICMDISSDFFFFFFFFFFTFTCYIHRLSTAKVSKWKR